LVDKINVVKPVTIDIRNDDPIAMVVVCKSEAFGRVVDGVVDKFDSALLQLVGELKSVKDLELTNCVHLGFFTGRQSLSTAIGIWILEFGY